MRAALRTASVLAVVGWFCVPVAAAAPLPQALTAQASPVCAQTPVSVAIGVQLTCTGYPSGSGNTLVLNADLTLGGVRTGVVAANDTIAQPNALANQHFPQTAPPPPNLIADEVVSSMANRTGAIAGVNGGFFDNDKGPIPGGSTDPFTGQPCGGVVRDGRILKSPPPGYQANLAVHAGGSLSIGAVGFVGAVVHGTDVFPLASINTLGDGGPQPPCPKAFAEPTHGLGITLLTPDLGALTLQNGANPGTTGETNYPNGPSNQRFVGDGFFLYPQAKPPPDAHADLQVGLHTPLFTPADSPVSSTLTVTNRGPHAANPTDATFVVPAGYTVQNNGGGTLPNGNFGGLNIFRTPPLAAGATATFTTRLIAPRGFAFGLSAALVVPVATDPNFFNNFALASTFSG